MRGRAIIPLVVGLGVGFLALKVFLNVLKQAHGAPAETVPVVFATADIEPTVEIQEAMVEVRQVPKDAAPDNGFHDKAEVVSRVTSWPIPKGCPIGAMQLAPKGTPPGMAVRITDGFRAVAVKTDESAGVAGWIKPGSRVDVVALLESPNRARSGSISEVILQNIEVLAVGQDIGKPSDTAANVTRTVTLLVTPADVPKLHLAETKGKLRLAMRNQHDSSVASANPTSENDLLALNSGSRDASQSENTAILRQFLGGQAKMPAEQTDKDKQSEAATAKPAAPAPEPWTVEVYKGPDAVETLKFERDAKDWRLVEGQDRHASRPVPAAPAAKPASILKSPLPAPAPAKTSKP